MLMRCGVGLLLWVGLASCGPSVDGPQNSETGTSEPGVTSDDPAGSEGSSSAGPVSEGGPACGNGVLDPNEECDPDHDSALIACADLSAPGKPYASGSASRCQADCTYERLGCGFCGDGVLDGSAAVDGAGTMIPAEWCDEAEFDEDRLAEQFGNLCPVDGQRPQARCGADCRSFDPPPDGETCCYVSGSDCPLPDSTVECCASLSRPDGDPCEQRFEGDVIQVVCR